VLLDAPAWAGGLRPTMSEFDLGECEHDFRVPTAACTAPERPASGRRRPSSSWRSSPGGGRRPACILTRQAAIAVLNAVLVVSATRTARGIPTEVALNADDGMPDDCVLAFDTSAWCARRC
jgi:hypothetical protein